MLCFSRLLCSVLLLQIVSKTMLVDLPSDRSYTLDEFVALQETSTSTLSGVLQGKNIEVENAVSDLVTVITGHVLDRHIEVRPMLAL